MSTTFEVYPRKRYFPRLGEFFELGRARIHEQLALRGVGAKPSIHMQIQKNKTHEPRLFDLSSPCVWGDDEYLWISVPGVLGGTDVSCYTIKPDDLEYWSSVFAEHEPAKVRQEELESCLSIGVYWSFRRSAGQPAIINFVYGVLAATLAELTNGYVFSDDSAWDYMRFPATAYEFYDWYFTPAKAIDPQFGEWAEKCLASISGDSYA